MNPNVIVLINQLNANYGAPPCMYITMEFRCSPAPPGVPAGILPPAAGPKAPPLVSIRNLGTRWKAAIEMVLSYGESMVNDG